MCAHCCWLDLKRYYKRDEFRPKKGKMESPEIWGFAWMEKKKEATLFRSKTGRNGIKRGFKVQSPSKLPSKDQIYSQDQSKGVSCQPTAPDNLHGTSIK